jgi:glutathione synthase/RimK-type ligase-like ATP-grasp enzyme
MQNPTTGLVLFSYRNHKHGYIELLFKRLSGVADNCGLSLERGSLVDMRIVIKASKLHIVESQTHKKLSAFDVVYFELWYKAQQQALAVALYAERHNIPFFSRELLHIMPITKIGELASLADHGISLPDSFMSSHRIIKKVFRKNAPFAYPFIMKAADGYGGNNNFLITSYAHLTETLDTHREISFIIQEFIPNDHDYRCIVLGNEIKVVLKRTRSKDAKSHLNNTSQGAEGVVVPIDELSLDARWQVLEAARLLDRSQFAGVDLMIHAITQKPYIIEVNQTPQIEIGAKIDIKMAALIEYMKSLAGLRA